MIRVLVGWALPILGLGLVAAFTGPDLVTGLGGTPMVVAASERMSLKHASFDGDACASTLLFGEEPTIDSEKSKDVRIVAYGLRPDGESIELGIRDASGPGGAQRETVALLFDETGELVGVSKPRALQPAASVDGDCLPTPEPSGRAPI